MTKLIVDMPMPQACPCELATEIEGNFYPCFAYYGVVERAVEFDKCMRDGKRPDWCPIKGELPEQHGELIDRDKAIFEMCEGLAPKGYRVWAKRYLKSEKINPTVIKAERKGDGRSET